MDDCRNLPPAGPPPPLASILTSRRRVVIACTNCRRRKIRCATDSEDDIPRNPCERCVKKGLKCEYITVADQFSTPPPASPSPRSSLDAPYYQLPRPEDSRAPYSRAPPFQSHHPPPPPGAVHQSRYLPHPDPRHRFNPSLPPLEISEPKYPPDSTRLPSFKELYGKYSNPGSRPQSPETVRLPPLRRLVYYGLWRWSLGWLTIRTIDVGCATGCRAMNIPRTERTCRSR
ncbi:hypothetical protein FB45DRAFT_48720 [Roridomyces roridus]|uniref:Zn(2)-C6 fungal-type domain-containing protein n=1 Tax=Roridomyces roridus TaxID=1738132 RepID=A0AAD7BSN4_9AGAR|nr:hypothetical protein FB45DRAFT_48720 [Roridomyces roridus]